MHHYKESPVAFALKYDGFFFRQRVIMACHILYMAGHNVTMRKRGSAA